MAHDSPSRQTIDIQSAWLLAAATGVLVFGLVGGAYKVGAAYGAFEARLQSLTTLIEQTRVTECRPATNTE